MGVGLGVGAPETTVARGALITVAVPVVAAIVLVVVDDGGAWTAARITNENNAPILPKTAVGFIF
jgi:hypothetical protein